MILTAHPISCSCGDGCDSRESLGTAEGRLQFSVSLRSASSSYTQVVLAKPGAAAMVLQSNQPVFNGL